MPSRIIHGMLYLPADKVLVVVLQNGRGTYGYFNVTEAEWTAFKRAPSKGTYYNTVFKAQHPHFEKVEDGLTAPPFRRSTAAGSPKVPSMPRDLPDRNIWGFFENTLSSSQ